MSAMATTGRFDHLRQAALDMLDSGNSMASVSQLLSVPVSVIQDWRAGPVPPVPQPARAPAAPAAGRAPGFGDTLVVTRGPSSRLWSSAVGMHARAALVIGLLVLGYRLWRQASFDGDVEVSVFPLIAAVVIWLCRSQVLVLLDAHAVVVPGWFGPTTLPYADLADWWLVMHVRNEGSDEEIEGRLLTLHSRRAGVRPIEVFIHDHVEIDPRVIERLDAVKQANQGAGPLTPLRANQRV